jgi:hypothetical protein
MKADQQANLERINERKSKSDVTHPLEPLIMSLIKGFVDDHDMSQRIKALYRVRIRKHDIWRACGEMDGKPLLRE